MLKNKSGLSIEELAEVMNDPLGFLASFVDIPNKEKKPVPFDAWPVQTRLIREMTGRDIWVKDSQCGSTSIISGVFLQDAIVHPNTTTVIMSHQEHTTQRLLWHCQIMIDSLPDWVKPRQDHKSTNEIRFPDINSVIYIATAKADVAGRGEPIHNLLLSEASFYPPGAEERIVVPALQRVPPTGRVVIESTPNGEEPVLYNRVQEALKEESIWKLQVVFWWDNPDNVCPAGFKFSPSSEKDDFQWTAEELAIAETARAFSKTNLTMENIRWRRWKIRESGKLFFQEHLESLDTCFLLMGEPYFDSTRISQLLEKAYLAPHPGPHGSQVWFPPEEGGFYIMGVDPGQGKVTESVASVWQVRVDQPIRHCARLATMDDPLTFDEPVKALATYYNMALINPEANGHGQGLIKGLVAWPHLYWRQNIVSGKSTNEIGWLTTGTTKPFMFQQMGYHLPTMETHDATLIQQIAGWRRNIDLKPPSSNGMTDHFMAACLALVAASNSVPLGTRGFKGFTGSGWCN